MKTLIHDGESEIQMDTYEIKNIINLHEAIKLFQTTAVFRDLCQDLQKSEPEMVESVDLHSLEDGYYLLLNRIAKETSAEVATVIAARTSLTIQLEKNGSIN